MPNSCRALSSNNIPKMQPKNAVKKALKSIAYKVVSREPLLDLARRTTLRNKTIVLMYHEIANDHDEVDAWTVVKKSDFIRHMEYLSSHFRVVSLGEAIDRMSRPIEEPSPPTPMAVVTFDDGYKGNRSVLLPIIQSMRIPITIFIASKALHDQTLYWYDRLINKCNGNHFLVVDLTYLSLGKYRINAVRGSENWRQIERLLTDLKTLEPNTREKVVDDIIGDARFSQQHDAYQVAPLAIRELRELSECPLITIGAHSHCHNLLTQLSDSDIESSVKTSKQVLESWSDRPVRYFAYPNGTYNNTVIRIVQASGFQCGLSTVPKPWEKRESLFTIPRLGIGRYDSFDYFKAKISGSLAS